MPFSFKKTLLFTGLSFSLVLAGCAGDSEGEDETEGTNSDQQEEAQDTEQEDQEQEQNQEAETASIEDQVQAYKDITAELDKMKEDQEVNWDMIKETYTSDLQPVLTSVNGEFDQAITAAIAAGKDGSLEQNAARQIIDKTTQSYFYQKQKSMHGDIAKELEEGTKEKAQQQFDQLKFLANEVFIPTAVKRDSYYELEGDSSLEQNINAGLTTQQEAIQEGNVDDYGVYKQITDKSIYRSYFLAAQSYAEKIEKAASEGASDDELTAEQAEAWGFYQAIKGSLSSGDKEAAEQINTLFSLDQTEPSTIKASEVNDLFVQAFVGKIKGYHSEAVEETKEGNITKARTEALEANMFTKAIEMSMNERLGEEQTKETLQKAESWLEAISNENAEEAEKIGQEIVSTLDKLVQ
ncbi:MULTISPECIES: hypothetical protein [Pontibacillus]|uniref:Lipoprotein n=1 Tax=Pontibacillus chungwhensis TaxID=265426 RepID=A0ABY8UUI8_9BACI|nr:MULTISPECIES: hypothetical protein [Pontibacillus]MCD5323783.1 hypothetical protein [Pontibacillus sp. HN14]WIF97147.1 hypothetical protein QNI29_15565 [Pontibacillus chungwhensis]